MLHPFIHDLSDKSLEELQTAINGLMTKIAFAQRTLNQPLVHQLGMALESYKTEYAKKTDLLLNKHNGQNKINIQKEGQ
jgi:hypothetical protein